MRCIVRLQGKKIAMLVAEGVEDYEYFVPMMRLQEEGAQVLTAALELKPLKGKNGLTITPDALIESLNADELFSIILPGGWAPDKLRRYDAVKNLVKKMDDAKKIIGIICHGGSTAISAGIIKKVSALQAQRASRMISKMSAGCGRMSPHSARATRFGGGLWRIFPISTANL
jgi:putative intracellular protease/amidase